MNDKDTYLSRKIYSMESCITVFSCGFIQSYRSFCNKDYDNLKYLNDITDFLSHTRL